MDEFVLNSTDDSEVCRLLAEARHESNSGLGRLLEAFRPALLELAEQSLGDPIRRRVSVSDLVQDTMLTACGQFAAFRGNSAPVIAEVASRGGRSRGGSANCPWEQRGAGASSCLRIIR